jgi:hypothetical protein
MAMSFVFIPDLNRLWTGSVTEVQPGNPLVIKANRWVSNEALQERFQFTKTVNLAFKIPYCFAPMWQERDIIEITHETDTDLIRVKNTRTKVSYIAGPDLVILY